MSVAEFMADVVAGWDASDDEVAAVMAKAPRAVAAYRAAFTQGTKTINSSASDVMYGVRRVEYNVSSSV
jgi:hypothetical protein